MVPVNVNDLQMLLAVAMRYSLGRRTYMPGLVQNLIKTHREVFSNANLRQLAEEITTEHRVYKGDLGDPADTKGWLDFCDWLTRTADAGVILHVQVPPTDDPDKGNT